MANAYGKSDALSDDSSGSLKTRGNVVELCDSSFIMNKTQRPSLYISAREDSVKLSLLALCVAMRVLARARIYIAGFNSIIHKLPRGIGKTSRRTTPVDS